MASSIFVFVFFAHLVKYLSKMKYTVQPTIMANANTITEATISLAYWLRSKYSRINSAKLAITMFIFDHS